MPDSHGTEPTVFDRLGPLPQVAALIDWRLSQLDKASGTIYLSFTAAAEFTNPAGHVHGGFIAAMLDECMGSAVVGLHEARFMPVTVSMSTDFIRPVQPGPVRGEGHVTSMGSSLAFLEAKLADPAGRVLTRATGAYRLLPFRDAVPEPPGEPERPG